MKNSTVVRSTALLLLGVLMVSATSVLAEPSTEKVVLKVSVADLNLQSDEGLQRLNNRIKRAARNACNHKSLREAGTLRVAQLSKQCVDDALRGAYSQLDSELLARLQDKDIERLLGTGNSDS